MSVLSEDITNILQKMTRKPPALLSPIKDPKGITSVLQKMRRKPPSPLSPIKVPENITSILQKMTRKPPSLLSPIKDPPRNQSKKSTSIKDKEKNTALLRIFGGIKTNNGGITVEHLSKQKEKQCLPIKEDNNKNEKSKAIPEEKKVEVQRKTLRPNILNKGENVEGNLKRKADSLEATDLNEIKRAKLQIKEVEETKLQTVRENKIDEKLLLNFKRAIFFSVGAEQIENFPNSDLEALYKTYEESLNLFKNVLSSEPIPSKLKIMNYRCQSIILYKMHYVKSCIVFGGRTQFHQNYLEQNPTTGIDLSNCQIQREVYERARNVTEIADLLYRSSDMWDRSDAETSASDNGFFCEINRKAGYLNPRSKIKDMAMYMMVAIDMIQASLKI